MGEKQRPKAARATGARKRTGRVRPAPAPAARLRVKQVRSGIGHAASYRRTLRALGLKHHQDEVVVDDSPSMRGMLFTVRHLVRVTPEES